MTAVRSALQWRRLTRLPQRATTGDLVMSAVAVAVTIGDFPLLADVDLEVRSGEVVALVGPNGAGKSTLLSVVAGDHPPAAGSVSIDGEAVSSWTNVELAQRRGVLLQQVDLSFPFTVAQVVRMGRAPWDGTDGEDRDDEAIARALDDADVAALVGREYTSLSGGERSRAALARVLAQEPGLLLLDEPTAALDIGHQEHVLEVVRRRAEAGDAVIVVMHDLNLAAAHADRVAVVSNGTIRASGRPDDVLDADLLSDVYQCRVETMRHPRTGTLLVHPWRDRPTPIRTDLKEHP